MSKEILLYDISHEEEKVKYQNSICIDEFDLYNFFMITHKKCKEFNKKMLMRYKQLPQETHVSLLKLSDKIFFEAIRILEIVKIMRKKDKEQTIIVKTKYNNLLVFLVKFLEYDFNQIVFEKTFKNNLYLNNRWKYYIYSVLLLMNSILVKKYDDENIFVSYNDKISFEFFKPYKDEALLFPMYDKSLKIKKFNYNIDRYLQRKFITFKAYKELLKNIYQNYIIIKRSGLPEHIKQIYINYLFILEMKSAIVYSLKDKFKNLKNIMGVFDANPTIDYITKKVNKMNIQTICIPHGINFKYKVSYISYGCNIYTLWSKNHLERMKSSNLLNREKTNLFLTGNVIYTNTLSFLEKKQISNKNILVIGEYFSTDNFYSSPFNEKTSKILFDALESFSKKHDNIRITIRTRLYDGYYQLAKKYISKNIKISSSKNSLIKEINEHDLIIAVFSNALHEALLLEKKVLQVNLLGIENYRDLAKDGLVYYADTEEKLYNILNKWYDDDLPKLDFKRHLKYYANNGKFQKINLGVNTIV